MDELLRAKDDLLSKGGQSLNSIFAASSWPELLLTAAED